MAKQYSEYTKEEFIAALEGKDKEIADGQALIVELNEKLEAATSEKAKYEAPIFSLKKEKYQVVVPQFNYEGRIVKAAEVGDNSELLAKLVEIGSGVVIKLQ